MIIKTKIHFMKQAMKNIKSAIPALLILLMLGATQTVAAAGTHEDPVALKYIGSVKNQPVFQLEINNPKEAEYVIRISDEAGNILYAEKAKGSAITKKFRLNDEELGDATLTFEVINKAENTVTSYKVKNNTHTVQDIEIAKS